jgi:type II secretory pathway pseudopilin PulG
MVSFRQSVKPVESEEGFILLMVLFLAVLLLIALAVAAPRIAISIQRDKEMELVHRGEQYKHAIKLYYKKFGTYPTSIDQLLNTDNIRFLRKKYNDPLTGKDDWRLIYLGQAKVPPLGFFGQPLAGLSGPTNVGTPIAGATGSSFMGGPVSGAAGGTGALGATGSTSSAFGASTFGSSDSGTEPQSPSASAASSGASELGAGTESSVAGTGTGTSETGGKDAAGFSIDTGDKNPIGGGPIVGVGLPSPKASLITYKKQTHYNQWEFVYNPLEDQMQAAGQFGAGVQTTSGAGSGTGTGTGITSGAGANSGFGNDNNGFGNNSGSFGATSGSSNAGSGGATSSSTGSNDQQQ